MRFSIRSRVLVAISMVALVTLLGTVLAWRNYMEVERLLLNLTDANRTSVSQALRIAHSVSRLSAAQPIAEDYGTIREGMKLTGFQRHAERFHGMLVALDNTYPDRASLGRVKDISQQLVENIAVRLEILTRFRLMDGRLQTGLDEVEQFARLLAERGANPLYIRAIQILEQGAKARTGETVQLNRTRFGALVEQLRSRQTDTAYHLLELGVGPFNLMDARAAYLEQEAGLNARRAESSQLLAALGVAVADLIARADDELTASAQSAEETLLFERSMMLAVSLISLVLPFIFVWMYLGRHIVTRLSDLAEAMSRIRAGDYATEVTVKGDDEIADMGNELLVFRDALVQLQTSSELLRKGEERMRTILETSPLAFAISQIKDGKLIYVNPRWIELYGVDETQALGHDSAQYYAESRHRLRLVDLVTRQGYISNFETRMRTGAGTEFWAMLSAATIEVDGVAAIFVASADITKRKEQEASLAEAKRIAEDASQAKSLFLATMSHEIRTPMNGVLTMAQLLEDMNLAAEQKEMARVIRDSAHSLLTIINDILDFSKIESGHLTLEHMDMDVVEVVESVAELLSPRLNEKGISLVTYVDPSLPALFRGDPMRLRQIILNLAGNAVKFTERGWIKITIAARPGSETGQISQLCFTVQDTGIGIEPEQQAKLFDPFTQGDTTIARRYGGTGLGLSICRRLVDMMSGEIGCDSRLGEGSTFWFNLPVEVAVAEPAMGPDLGGSSVLLLGENQVAAEALRRYLTHINAQVSVVNSTDAALAATRAAAQAGWHYDVVLIDGADDFKLRLAVARAIMQAAGSSALTKVVMTAPHATYSEDADEAREAGLFSTLSKPVSRSALWRGVAAAVGRLLPSVDEDKRADQDIYWPPTYDEAMAAGALILVAEDNPTNQVVIRHLMERLGYAIELVSNGNEAWERIQFQDFGLLLTDCHMPGMDGYELTRQVRQWEQSNLSRLPIVALTADALVGTAKKCQQVGMDAYLAKPIDRRQLDMTIRKLLPKAVALRRRRIMQNDVGTATIAPVSDNSGARDDAFIAHPVLDLSNLIEIFDGLTDDARNLLTLFVDSTRPILDELQKSLAQADMAEAAIHAHAAKGAGNSAGAVRFAKMAAEMEATALRGDAEVAATLLPLLLATFDEAQSAIAEFTITAPVQDPLPV